MGAFVTLSLDTSASSPPNPLRQRLRKRPAHVRWDAQFPITPAQKAFYLRVPVQLLGEGSHLVGHPPGTALVTSNLEGVVPITKPTPFSYEPVRPRLRVLPQFGLKHHRANSRASAPAGRFIHKPHVFGKGCAQIARKP